VKAVFAAVLLSLLAPVVAESADRGLVVVGNRTFDLNTGAVVEDPLGDSGARANADGDQSLGGASRGG
jgi:hypothetical protein